MGRVFIRRRSVCDASCARNPEDVRTKVRQKRRVIFLVIFDQVANVDCVVVVTSDFAHKVWRKL